MFQSTHSLRSATPVAAVFDILPEFQSTHSLRSATRLQPLQYQSLSVSIHALLAECDSKLSTELFGTSSFNPRTPCGVRLCPPLLFNPRRKFQSTHSLRSATEAGRHMVRTYDVSIHALLAECDKVCEGRGNVKGVSIHALLAECDMRQAVIWCAPAMFQSTHSLRSATMTFQNGQSTPLFQSTHSLRSATFGIFWIYKCSMWFQSTHSLRSATISNGAGGLVPQVSIHALLAECDR